MRAYLSCLLLLTACAAPAPAVSPAPSSPKFTEVPASPTPPASSDPPTLTGQAWAPLKWVRPIDPGTVKGRIPGTGLGELMALPDLVVAGNALVQLTTVGRSALPGLAARTDTSGFYRLTRELPATPFLVDAYLDASSQHLLAFVPVPHPAEVRLDVVSTLTYDYLRLEGGLDLGDRPQALTADAYEAIRSMMEDAVANSAFVRRDGADLDAEREAALLAQYDPALLKEALVLRTLFKPVAPSPPPLAQP